MILTALVEWLDLLWVPLAYALAHKKQKLKAVLFVSFSIMMLRLQVELMQEIGFSLGILKFFNGPVLYRGMIIYGFFIGIFLFLMYLSKEKDPYIFIAAAISVFMMAFCLSSVAMVL